MILCVAMRFDCDCLGDLLSEGCCVCSGSHIVQIMVELKAWFLVRNENVNHLYSYVLFVSNNIVLVISFKGVLSFSLTRFNLQCLMHGDVAFGVRSDSRECSYSGTGFLSISSLFINRYTVKRV